MHNIAKIGLIFLLSSTVPLLAKNGCDIPQLQHQQQDAATIQRLENAWSLAFLQGDTQFMSCLLLPDFTEIMHSGEVKFLSDELAMAANNRGKHLPIPQLPVPKVLLHNNVAVAFGESVSSGQNDRTRKYSDSYVWENGRWRVFFAQQTEARAHDN